MAMSIGKGEIAEEVLRNYFIEQGYFVVRSLPFTYNQIDITDVDLWLYEKASPFTRARTNVDIKNKSNPQAFERIVWSKGLQVTLGLDKTIVATTSTRKEAREFGLTNDVTMLDGTFLNYLIQKGINQNRITEEDFIVAISNESCGKKQDDWKARYLVSKSKLLTKLNFDGCNEYLKEIHYFLEQCLIREHNTATPLRILYINIAYFLLSIDYIVKNYLTLDQNTRIENLANGFNYGERGKERTEAITNAAIRLASSVIANPNVVKTLQMEVNKQIKNRPVEILADFFSRISNINSLFDIAKSFESFSYSTLITTPTKLPAELQGIIGLLSDFLQIDRKKILNL